MSADILHEGHINILKIGKKYGKVIVGLMTDKAIVSYKRLPHLDYNQRKIILENLKLVDEVVPQTELDYTRNLIKIKPDYVIHGDDWKFGTLKNTRSTVIKTLKKWSGKIIEPKYTKNISSTKIKNKIFQTGTTSDNRRGKLRRLLITKEIVRVIESHSPITGLIIEKLNIKENNKYYTEFDAMWSSSLTDSTLKGKPDNQSLDYSSRLLNLKEIMEVTTKPVIFDGDNGGNLEHLPYLIRSLDQLGVSAIILEDKIGLKKNSLFNKQSDSRQDTVNGFCKKIKIAKKSQVSDEFMVIARIESFILNKGLNDAFNRAKNYLKSGADALMIHSKLNNPNEVYAFAKKIRKFDKKVVLIAVPSTYSGVSEQSLIKNGFSVVIYANHLLRASIPAMINTAKKILISKKSKTVEKDILSIKEILNYIDNND